MPIRIKSKWRRKNAIFKPRRKRFLLYLAFGGLLALLNLLIPATLTSQKARAINCPDLKIIFARGSGEERWVNQNYLTFKSELEEKLNTADIRYEFEDLNYPAINVANPLTLITTFISGGEAYNFGNSVNAGVKNLTNQIVDSSCPNTKYVIGGYSQGAMVVSKAIRYLSPDKIIYAATFGDPKIHLPEGLGAVPPACSGKNLSDYRIYVPDCRAYSGLLGGYRPYQPEEFYGKLGTWCNKKDIFCSSYLSMRDHTSYVADSIYADASKHIFDKITKAFGIKNSYVSLHDTAILIDSTASMAPLFEEFRSEALKLAKDTLESGGRVALYDYRDIKDQYPLNERCNFDTCTLETFQDGLNKISLGGGGDNPESLLSASVQLMKRLDWNYGSTKSVVVLTDDTYHEPDLDGTTFDDVVKLSKSIDPVNFYFIVPEDKASFYTDLATATDGGVTIATSDLALLTDAIMARYDSLPRVEEIDDNLETLPEISDVKWEMTSSSQVRLSWNSTGTRTLFALNDLVLGVTDKNEIVLSELDSTVENIVTLVPLSDTQRGVGVSAAIYGGLVIPKAPDTGRR